MGEHVGGETEPSLDADAREARIVKWSYSRHATMRRCQRLLVFSNVLASHNARDLERHEAYILKQLQGLAAWRGSLVHAVLATSFLAALRAHRQISAVALTTQASALARRQFAFSAARRYREPGQTKAGAGADYCALFEHEYNLAIPPDAVATASGVVARCFEHLMEQSAFLKRLYAGSRHVAEVPLNFRMDGVAVAAVPDLVFVRPDGHPSIVDWKVANSDTSDYTRHLLVHALVVARCGQWGRPQVDGIELFEVNLLKNEIRQHTVNPDLLDETEDFVYRSAAELEDLIGGDTAAGMDLNEFEVAGRPLTCFHCHFARMCVQQLQAANRFTEAETVQGRVL